MKDMTMVSSHLSVARHYWWFPPVKWWNLRRAARCAVYILRFDSIMNRSAEELEVLGSAFLKAPWWLGGDVSRAERCVDIALRGIANGRLTAESHTKALLLISKRDVHDRRGEI
ncbi:MAG: hypothetical protein Q8O98_02065 [bacterium]|nr:hypothetical protein [bacterium]